MFWQHQVQSAAAGWVEISTYDVLHHGCAQEAEAPTSATA
jgi:hypothetical protein